jgi:hypothetical protein
VRVPLVAAGALLAADPADTRAAAVLNEAWSDASVRVRRAALELVAALGERGVGFLGALKKREMLEEDPQLREKLARLTELRLTASAATAEAQKQP